MFSLPRLLYVYANLWCYIRIFPGNIYMPTQPTLLMPIRLSPPCVIYIFYPIPSYPTLLLSSTGQAAVQQNNINFSLPSLQSLLFHSTNLFGLRVPRTTDLIIISFLRSSPGGGGVVLRCVVGF